MISIEVRAQIVQRQLNQLAAQLDDRRAVNQAVGAKLFQLVMDNFASESHDGEPWAALAPSTVDARIRKATNNKRKRAALRAGLSITQILQDTGAMRQSFLPFSDNEVAGVGSRSEREHADLSKIHEEGIGVPRRPMLPSKARALEAALVIYGHFVERAVHQ